MRAGRLSLLLIPLLVACGTISHGPMQQIRVNSNPMGALVSSDGCGNDAQFKTPGHFMASRRSSHCTVRISSDGYETATVQLQRMISKGDALWFDLGEPQGVGEFLVEATVYAFFAVVSVGVDYASGGAYELYPSRISIELHPLPDDDPPPSHDEESGAARSSP